MQPSWWVGRAHELPYLELSEVLRRSYAGDVFDILLIFV